MNKLVHEFKKFPKKMKERTELIEKEDIRTLVLYKLNNVIILFNYYFCILFFS